MSVQTQDTAVGATPPPVDSGAPPTAGPGRARGRRAAKNLTPYLLLLPALAGTAVLLGWPLVRNFLLSFQSLNMRELIQHLTVWNGVENYRQIFEGEFWRVVVRTVVFTAVNVVLIMLLGTAVGLLLARLGKRMRITLSSGLVLAWAVPTVAATTVFQWLFDSRGGVANWVLDHLGWHSMARYDWVGSQLSTFTVITLLIVWQSIPFVALNLYAATTTIAKELYEAARMDGAGAWQVFTHVTLPFLRPFFLATTFLEVIWVFKAFPQVFAINGGGPDRLTETLPIYAYTEGVGNQHFGAGAAISVLTIVVLVALTGYYLRLTLKQEEGEL